jgi:hypothetical protein
MRIQEVKKVTNKLVDDYNKPTPKGWKIAGRILKIVGRTLAGTALLGAVGPYVGLAALLAGEIIGEVINFKTE